MNNSQFQELNLRPILTQGQQIFNPQHPFFTNAQNFSNSDFNQSRPFNKTAFESNYGLGVQQDFNQIYSSRQPRMIGTDSGNSSGNYINQLAIYNKVSSQEPSNEKLHSKKTYSVTSDEARRRFISVWNSGTKTIKEASEECGINYSTAKSIVKLLKQEGRIEKKKKRASRKNKLLIAELEAAIRSNQFKRPRIYQELDQEETDSAAISSSVAYDNQIIIPESGNSSVRRHCADSSVNTSQLMSTANGTSGNNSAFGDASGCIPQLFGTNVNGTLPSLWDNKSSQLSLHQGPTPQKSFFSQSQFSQSRGSNSFNRASLESENFVQSINTQNATQNISQGTLSLVPQNNNIQSYYFNRSIQENCKDLNANTLQIQKMIKELQEKQQNTLAQPQSLGYETSSGAAKSMLPLFQNESEYESIQGIPLGGGHNMTRQSPLSQGPLPALSNINSSITRQSFDNSACEFSHNNEKKGTLSYKNNPIAKGGIENALNGATPLGMTRSSSVVPDNFSITKLPKVFENEEGSLVFNPFSQVGNTAVEFKQRLQEKIQELVSSYQNSDQQSVNGDSCRKMLFDQIIKKSVLCDITPDDEITRDLTVLLQNQQQTLASQGQPANRATIIGNAQGYPSISSFLQQIHNGNQ